MTSIATASGVLKEAYGEENVKDIHIGKYIFIIFNFYI